MGCDIHLVLEKKVNDQWIGLHAFQTFSGHIYNNDNLIEFDWFSTNVRNRDYELFGKLAGVRGDGPKPKGLPNDASPLARHVLEDDSDIHSQTWWMLEDVLGLFAGHGLGSKILSEDRREKALRLFGLWGEDDLDDYRLCIGFDN